MARHYRDEHEPRRRLFGIPARRCRCGHLLPCVVRAAIERQQYFVPPAAPEWNAPTTRTDVIQRFPPDRPLMTPGQRARSETRARP